MKPAPFNMMKPGSEFEAVTAAITEAMEIAGDEDDLILEKSASGTEPGAEIEDIEMEMFRLQAWAHFLQMRAAGRW